MYFLKVTRNNAAVAMALNMPQGKEIMYAEIIALIVTMTTQCQIHSSCIEKHLFFFFFTIILHVKKGVLAEIMPW